MLVLSSISLKTNLHRHTVLHTLRLFYRECIIPVIAFSASPCRQRKALPECPPHRGGPVRPGGSGGQRISGLSAVHSVRGGSVGGPGRGCRLQGSSSGQWGQPRRDRMMAKTASHAGCPADGSSRSIRTRRNQSGLLFQNGHPTGAGRNLRPWGGQVLPQRLRHRRADGLPLAIKNLPIIKKKADL